MSLISAVTPNFINGVSQQPYQLRLNSQGQSQENGHSTVYSGLRKRGPTEHLAKISNTPLTDCFVHTINRDDIEQYQVILTNGDLKVYDLSGLPRAVSFTDKIYLNTVGLAGSSFALTTVADYTFIVNTSIKVLAGTAAAPARPFDAIVSVKSGNYGKTYAVTINGTVVASYATPDGSVASQSSALATEAIATQLLAAMVTSGYNTAPWSTVRYGPLLYVQNSSVDFKITCDDGFNNNAMVAIKGKLQKFSDLPAFPRVDGFTVEIVGDKSSDFDNYWVKFDAGANNSVGVWRETLQPGTRLGLNPLTLPHQLIRNADGSFTFQPCTWANRLVGDIASNPDPSFVGRTINDIFFFQNRLGFLSDENFLQSETGKYFNVFRTTVTTLLDSDPVDVNAATDKVAILQHAVSFNKQLLLFSKQQQFIVDSSVLMSPKKVPIRPTTNFVVNCGAKPVTCGRNIYFAADKGSWSAIREYYPETISTVNDASDVTAHVPMYIPADVVKIAAGPAEDVMAILSKGDRTKLFIYKYFFSGTDKLQSSWSTYTFSASGTILNCDFVKSILYVVISRADGVYIEKLDFAIGAQNTGEPYHVLLDRKVRVPATALSYAAGVTTISLAALGYTPNDASVYQAVTLGGAGVLAGQILPVTWTGANATVPGNVTTSALAFGQAYAFRYTASTFVVSTSQPSGAKIARTDGRTQVRKVTFNYADTGYFQILVTPKFRQTYTYTFSGVYLGTGSAILGTRGLDSDQFSAAVMARNTQVTVAIESLQPMPVSIMSADWEAFFTDRSTNV